MRPPAHRGIRLRPGGNAEFNEGGIGNKVRKAGFRIQNTRGQNRCSLLFEDNNGIFHPNIQYGWIINICALDQPCSCVNKKGANNGCDNY